MIASKTSTLSCNDTETLLNVTYDLDRNRWDELSRSLAPSSSVPYLSIRPDNDSDGAGVNNTSLHYRVEYQSFSDLRDYLVCVPTVEGCLKVEVAALPTDSYEVSYGGVVVPTVDVPAHRHGGRAAVTTATMVGNACCGEHDMARSPSYCPEADGAGTAVSGGQIAGMVVASLGLLAVATIALVPKKGCDNGKCTRCCRRRRRKKKRVTWSDSTKLGSSGRKQVSSALTLDEPLL